jgi:hypothetical protein
MTDFALLAIEPDLAGIGKINTGDTFHQRRLAGAIVADDAHHLAATDLERNPAQRFDVTKILSEIDDAE